MICLVLLVTTAGDAWMMRSFGPTVAGVGGLVAGAVVAWGLARAIENTYYRTALAMLAIFGTVLLGALAVPAHILAGRWGLAALGAGCVAAIPVARRWFLGRST